MTVEQLESFGMRRMDNEDIEEVQFRFRITERRLDEMDVSPENVALYRFNETTGEWVEHATEFLGMKNGSARFRTTADGASEWTAAAKRPDLDITDTSIDVRAATTADEITIQVFVTNTGGAEGNYEAQLLANEEVRQDFLGG
jgi:hypothetical protein